MRPVVIIGTGGHGREVAEIVQAAAAAGRGGPLIGWLTDDVQQHGQQLSGLPIFGPPAWLSQHPEVSAIIAIGANPVRQRIAARLPSGWHSATAISPHALISPQAQVAAGTMVFPGVVIGPNVRIGAHSIVNVGASISHDSHVGAWCNLNPGARLAGNVQLAEGVNIGMGALVIQGRQIGAWSIVGAGSVVIRDLPERITAVGVPARRIKAQH